MRIENSRYRVNPISQTCPTNLRSYNRNSRPNQEGGQTYHRITEFYDAVTDAFERSRIGEATIKTTSSGPSYGRTVNYSFSAIAIQKGLTSPFAVYTDSPPRIHNLLEDGRLDIGTELTDFSEQITKDLTNRGLRVKLDNGKITLTKH